MMKRLILLLFVLFSLASCRKEEQIPANISPIILTTLAKAKLDTIPDSAAFGLKLFKDSTIYDGIRCVFNHKSSLRYVVNEDAPYFQGFGKVSLASISSDGKDLSINALPYKSGMEIGLNVHAKTSGIYFLTVNYKNKIPSNIQIWVKDTYLKDSTNISSQNYSFNVIKADTNSFGCNRFKLIIKDSGQ